MIETVPVYILAGGRSSRFGSDKARLELDGQPIILRLADMLKPVAQRLVVVADLAATYADLGMPIITDRVHGRGPVGGLDAVLADRLAVEGPGWVLLVACDTVELRLAWIRGLFAHARDDVQAVAYRADHWQTLMTLYHTSLMPHVQRHLEQDDRSLRRLLESVRVATLPQPDDWPDIFQINTPEQWQLYQEQLRRDPAP